MRWEGRRRPLVACRVETGKKGKDGRFCDAEITKQAIWDPEVGTGAACDAGIRAEAVVMLVRL